MHRKARTHVVTTGAICAVSAALLLNFTTPAAAHRGQQAFDTLETITGAQPERLSTVVRNASGPDRPLTGRALISTVFPKETLQN